MAKIAVEKVKKALLEILKKYQIEPKKIVIFGSYLGKRFPRY